MSELNEDILNYEIGDVDADDTDLTGADEDELLLSDDESISGRLAPNQENDGDLLSCGQTESETHIEQSTDRDSVVNKNDNALQSSDDNYKTAETTIECRTAGPSSQAAVVQPAAKTSPCQSPGTDQVSSTYREDEDEIQPQPTQSQPTTTTMTAVSSEQKDSDPSFCSDEQSESTVYEDSEVSHSQSQSEQTDSKSESVVDAASEENQTSSEQTLDDYDADDSDNVRERRNPKTCVEREQPPPQFDENNKSKPFSHNYQRNRHSNRPQMPRPPPPNLPYGMPPVVGPDFNAAFMPQFHGARRPMPPVSQSMQSDFIRGGHPMMRGPPNHMQRMPPGMPPSRMPGGPGMIGPPHQRLPRPPFQSPGMFGNNPGMGPQRMIRPRGPPMIPPQQQRPPFVPFAPPNHPQNMRLPMNPSLPPRAQPPLNAAIPSPSLPLPIIGAPRKVLINPNFKGGVQAATNQLMLDTMKNSQILESKREEELLRQQEAFINQNRLHLIEKRRRSREHSPNERDRERDYRDRERSYSPPARRRERDVRKPYPSFRENRTRRADSRDRDNPDLKRKRSDGDNNPDKNDPKTDEDEETRAYRLEIEKQKAQREKILRDKEMQRRRKAAEILKKEEDKKVVDEPLQKFTPIIVTEKKIISLKKKLADGPGESTSQKPKALSLARKMAATENMVVESGSQIKTVLRSSGGAKKMRLDSLDDDIDEDELLADSPPATPAPVADATTLQSRTQNAQKVDGGGDIPKFTNRRVVVRNADNAVANNENNLTTTKPGTGGKGIFDRLDKKVISVNEAAKRKIQRIVINNSD